MLWLIAEKRRNQARAFSLFNRAVAREIAGLPTPGPTVGGVPTRIGTLACIEMKFVEPVIPRMNLGYNSGPSKKSKRTFS